MRRLARQQNWEIMPMPMVKCPRCFHINPDGVEQCVKCHTALPKIRIEAAPAPPPPPSPPQNAAAIQFRRGQVFATRYTVLNLIGRGGMGCIYKVHDNVLGEEVALKTLLPQFVKDKLVVTRFINEARIARKMAHPNIVRVHDIGSADSIVYISMEYLQGKSLRGVLENLPSGQRLPLKQVLSIFDELCAALEYAHQYTVHRDIKPENVMIGLDGNVKLMDFGISKLMANTRLTGASIVMGTPFYMSPEQLRNSRDVDARADIFSLGVMLYEVLTGNLPTGVPKPASQIFAGLPPALDAIIEKCLEPDPKDRYQNVVELRTALLPLRQLCALGDDLRAATEQRRKPLRGQMRRLSGAFLALCVVLGAAAGLYSLEQRRQAQAGIHAPGTLVVTPAAPARLHEIEEMIALIQPRAELRAKDNPVVQDLLETAGQQWTLAQSEARQQQPQSGESAEEALRAFLACLMWREGMVYIPGGPIQIEDRVHYVPAFFMDTTEVSLGAFFKFCQEVRGGWRFPPELAGYQQEYQNLPITRVSFYDAQAFAAEHGRRLPTEAQWARAAYGFENASRIFPWGDTWKDAASNLAGAYSSPLEVKSMGNDRTLSECWDMAGNVSEWTRSPAPGMPAEAVPDFGVKMIVRGGNFKSPAPVPLHQSSTVPFETRADDLGFRCVTEIPAAPDAVRRLLQRLP